ncbi:MAG: arsenate reductase ArsC [Bacteroidetes bacterium]|nr:arsenate reductase ArsC [Bacteroidota bacterium]
MKKNILFVCIENSNRSQMAQAFATMDGGSLVVAYSAGSRPSGRINPRAIAAMQELGYDLTRHDSRSLSEIPDIVYDYVVTMGCGDACPHVRALHRVDWSIPDPRDMEPADFTRVRDQIRRQVGELLAQIGRE